MKINRNTHIALLFAILLSIAPLQAKAFAVPPPADMFQLPWEQGQAWVAFDGFDNGIKRPSTSPHNYAPKKPSRRGSRCDHRASA